MDLILPSFTRRPSLVTGTLIKAHSASNARTKSSVRRTTPSPRPCGHHGGVPCDHGLCHHVHVQIHHVRVQRQPLCSFRPVTGKTDSEYENRQPQQASATSSCYQGHPDTDHAIHLVAHAHGPQNSVHGARSLASMHWQHSGESRTLTS